MKQPPVIVTLEQAAERLPITDVMVRREANWLRDDGNVFAAALLERLWREHPSYGRNAVRLSEADASPKSRIGQIRWRLRP